MAGFARVMAAYPELDRWFDPTGAERNCQARIARNGETWESLERRATAYRIHCESGGPRGKGIRNPDSFFDGDAGPWAFDWKPVAAANGSAKKTTTWSKTAAELETDHIAQAIAAGRTDQDIANEIEVPVERVRQQREELAHAEH